MTPMAPSLSLALLVATALVCGLLAFATLLGRFIRTQRERALAVRQHRARGFIPRILDGEQIERLARADRSVLIRLASQLAGQVRGQDRTALINWLMAQGLAEQCIRQLRSPFAVRRARALSLFAPMAYRSPRVVAALLSDRNQRVRNLAAQISGLSATPGVIPELLTCLSSKRPFSRGIISMAVLRTAPASSLEFGQTLIDSNPTVRALAIELAGQLNLADAREQIEAGLFSPSEPVRHASLNSLKRLGSPQSLFALASFTGGSDIERGNAQLVMAEIKAS